MTDDHAIAELVYRGTSIWTPEEGTADAAGAYPKLEMTSKHAGTNASHAPFTSLDHAQGPAASL